MNNSLNIKENVPKWIGSIQSKWEIKKIKYIFWERKENNNPIKSDNLISLTIEKGVIPHSEKTGAGNKPKDDISKYKLVYPGDIVINSMNVIVGAVGISKYFGICSPVYYILIPKNPKSYTKYFHYLFRSEIFQKSLHGLGNGILIKENEKTGKLNTIRMRIPIDKLGDQFIPLPPIEEQQLISEYLDNKIDKINNLIYKIQSKIQILQEQQNARINNFTTKGLETNVEFKNSGLQYVDKIPKHWSVRKIATIGTFSKGKNITKDDLTEDGEPVILYSHLYTTYSRLTNVTNYNVSKEKFLDATKIKKNTFLFTSSGETIEEIGKTLLYNGEGEISIGGDIIVFNLNSEDNFDPEFLSYSFNSKNIQDQKSSMSRGEIVVHIYKKQLREIIIAVPPKLEQIKIRKKLNQHERRTNKLINLLNNKIHYLTEYRQSLISNIVIGKLKKSGNIK